MYADRYVYVVLRDDHDVSYYQRQCVGCRVVVVNVDLAGHELDFRIMNLIDCETPQTTKLEF
jgi:hypothetical protein